MSSTDDTQTSLADTFYEEHILPLARRLDRAMLLDAQPLHEGSFYSAIPRDVEQVEQLPDVDGLAERLERLWGEGAIPELGALAAPLMALAKAVRAEDEDSDDVSPFLYTLF